MKYVNIVGRRFLMIYWAIFKPLSFGTRVMLLCKNEVLLVKHTYISGYFLPGGGVKKSELFENSARRELKEEVGILVNNLSVFGIYKSIKEQKYTTNVVFISKLSKKPTLKIQKDELVEAGFFNINKLPLKTSPGTKRRIKEYIEGNFPITGEW